MYRCCSWFRVVAETHAKDLRPVKNEEEIILEVGIADYQFYLYCLRLLKRVYFNQEKGGAEV